MPITFNSGTSTQGNAASFTFAHVVAGSNPVLLVSVGQKSATYPLVSGITWNTSENLVKATGANFSSTQTGDLWYLLNPSAVSANIVVTLFNSARTVCNAVSYAGVDSVVTSNITLASAQNTSGTSTITTVNTNSVVVDAFSVRDTNTLTNNNSSYTLRSSNATTGSPAGNNTTARIYDQGVGTNLAIGSYTTSYTIGATEAWVDIQVELKEKANLAFSRGYVIKAFK